MNEPSSEAPDPTSSTGRIALPSRAARFRLFAGFATVALVLGATAFFFPTEPTASTHALDDGGALADSPASATATTRAHVAYAAFTPWTSGITPQLVGDRWKYEDFTASPPRQLFVHAPAFTTREKAPDADAALTRFALAIHARSASEARDEVIRVLGYLKVDAFRVSAPIARILGEMESLPPDLRRANTLSWNEDLEALAGWTLTLTTRAFPAEDGTLEKFVLQFEGMTK